MVDSRQAIHVARRTEDPALLLQALDGLLPIEDNEGLLSEARALAGRIVAELPDDAMQRRFQMSDTVQRLS